MTEGWVVREKTGGGLGKRYVILREGEANGRRRTEMTPLPETAPPNMGLPLRTFLDN
jgi:hypothetical protein